MHRSFIVDQRALPKINYSKNPLTVRLPNVSTRESTHTASIYIPEVSRAASIAHFFPRISKHSLLSVHKLCNEGYSVTFKIDAVTVYNPHGVQILRGERDLKTGIWRISMRQ
jgi:hypothetical protein